MHTRRLSLYKVSMAALCTIVVTLGYTSIFYPEMTEKYIGIISHEYRFEEMKMPASREPRMNLYFLKTHKTGSSTLQNILARYAWINDLVVGLPTGSVVFSSYYDGGKFSAKEMQAVPPDRSINMIFHHMIFDSKEVSSVMPKDSVYVTVLRNPTTLFPSAFRYFRDDLAPFGRASKVGLSGFFEKPTKYFKGPNDGQFWWLAKNGMFADLGFNNMNESESYLRQSILKIEQTFDFVLITEYFDIGLILLKSLMNWDIKDVVYASMNRQKSSSMASRQSQDKKVQEKICNWNKADTELYKFFNDTFWKRVEVYGEDKIKRELQELETLKHKYRKFCFEEKMILNEHVSNPKLKMFNPKGIDILQYQLRNSMQNNETCLSLILPERQWWTRLAYRQRRTINRKWKLMEG